MALPQVDPETVAPKLDIPPKIIRESPVLQKWLREEPNVLEDIRNDPSFRTRLRLGLVTFPSTDNAVGIDIGIEDVFIDRTGFTVSADYQAAFNGDRTALGTDLHYFLFPLGSYINLAPLVGYRYVQSNDFNTDGVNLGVRMMLALSRTGAGDISISQSFISPGGNEEVGITSVSAGYAVTSKLRLSSELELQNSPEDEDTRFGINLEWLF
ncbi:hypothetical protein [Myxosarcina sp. GI1]|uniref:hypothetical protein n=1 Tax=Myxosarcina sp. GI1 TaxID=1541065 RepID=UPI003529BBF6